MHARAPSRVLPGVALGWIVIGVPALAAQAPAVRLSGRVQAQYRVAAGDATLDFDSTGNNVLNGFEIRRLRIQTDVRVGDRALIVIQPSFEMGSLRMRDAFLRIALTPRLGVTMGQEKSPFQRYELASSNALPSIERGVRILSLRRREALNDLLVANGYASHDVGAFVDWAAPGERLLVKVGVQNGSRESAADVNNAKSLFARATGVVLRDAAGRPLLGLGIAVAARDRAVCRIFGTAPGACTTYWADSSKTTTAWGFEAEWGSGGGRRSGYHVIADVATGDNVRPPQRINSGRNTGNLVTTSDTNVVTFRAAHVVASYRVRSTGAEHRLVRLVEPALRLDYTDPDVDASGDDGLLVTPAVSVHFTETTLVRAAFDWYRYRDGSGASRTARELKIHWQASF